MNRNQQFQDHADAVLLGANDIEALRRERVESSMPPLTATDHARIAADWARKTARENRQARAEAVMAMATWATVSAAAAAICWIIATVPAGWWLS